MDARPPCWLVPENWRYLVEAVGIEPTYSRFRKRFYLLAKPIAPVFGYVILPSCDPLVSRSDLQTKIHYYTLMSTTYRTNLPPVY